MPVDLLSHYFLSPTGLLALLGLVPLIAFYYFKPEPEEKVMPSMQFFAKEEKSGVIHRAWNRLMKNILLLVHVLVILGFAAALADLSLGGGVPDDAVIVLDRSASMSSSMDDAKSFVESNLGNSNTLILVDDDIEIPLEKASSGEVRRYLDSVESRDTRTDIAGGLDVAQGYDGTVVVASDLKQTVSDRSTENMVESMVTEGRDVRLMDTAPINSWGIIDVNPGRHNTSVDIKNFRSTGQHISVEVNGNTEEVRLDADEVRTLKFSSSDLSRVSLPPDEMDADDSAYVSVPGEQEFDVLLISDDGNPYLEKAVELVDFTNIRTARPPVNTELDADVYVIGETDRILTETAEEIDSQVQEGASVVTFAQPRLRELDMEALPGELGGAGQENVEIEEPQRINIGPTTVYDFNKSQGESLSHPENAVIRSSHGRGEVLFYNVNDQDFRYDFLYPIFWKNVLEDLTGRPTVEELNVFTGESINDSRIETPSGEHKQGEIKITETGFYNTSRGVYAANLASEAESQPEEIEPDLEVEDDEGERSLQNLLVLLLAGIALTELIYLRHTGDI